ncbi:MAG: DMP19 family protein [Thermodesulfobacteriota bacterium]
MCRKPYTKPRNELGGLECLQVPMVQSRPVLGYCGFYERGRTLGSKKKIKKFIKDLGDPQILTLDEAFTLREQTPDPDDWSSNQDPDGRVVDAVLARIGCRFSGPHNIAALTYGERLVLEVTVMMGEVLNGGFHQYLWNSSGDSAQHVRSMLRDIRAMRTADMLDRISGSFPEGRIPEEREARWRIIEELETENPGVDLFVEEDRAFYQGDENLYPLLVAYIRNHRDEFVDPEDGIVRKLKRQQRVREHLGVEDDPAALEEAEETLKAIEAQFNAIQEEFRREQLSLIGDLLAKGRKMEAIKAYRSAFDCSPSDAKAAVEAMKQSQ